ncbi:MAG TPA: S1C family serine protease [Solirubrobacteraceae bacterium]|jgi:serine protease Do
MAVLEEIGQAVAAAAERVGPAVVGLGRGWGRGSGVVVARDTVLTNAHVLRGEEVAVRVGGGEEAALGRVAGVDVDLDLAVVKVDTGDAEPVAWEPEAVDAVGVGTPVFALADPGGRGLRATAGFVSATNRSFRGPGGRRIRGTVEHSAPLPRGASGGPLVDLSGRLLGLNAIRLEGGLILAVPADAAMRRRVDALARGEAAERPRLGVALAPPRAARRLRAAVGLPEREGLLVRGVEDDSPAGRAGLERGDLLVAAAGRPLDSVDALFDALEGAAAGGSLALTVVRGTEEREVTVPLA